MLGFQRYCLLNGWVSLHRWWWIVDLVSVSVIDYCLCFECWLTRFPLGKKNIYSLRLWQDLNHPEIFFRSHFLKSTSQSFHPSTTALSCFTFLRLHSAVHDKQENNDSVEEPHWNLPGQHNSLQTTKGKIQEVYWINTKRLPKSPFGFSFTQCTVHVSMDFCGVCACVLCTV